MFHKYWRHLFVGVLVFSSWADFGIAKPFEFGRYLVPANGAWHLFHCTLDPYRELHARLEPSGRLSIELKAVTDEFSSEAASTVTTYVFKHAGDFPHEKLGTVFSSDHGVTLPLSLYVREYRCGLFARVILSTPQSTWYPQDWLVTRLRGFLRKKSRESPALHSFEHGSLKLCTEGMISCRVGLPSAVAGFEGIDFSAGRFALRRVARDGYVCVDWKAKTFWLVAARLPYRGDPLPTAYVLSGGYVCCVLDEHDIPWLVELTSEGAQTVELARGEMLSALQNVADGRSFTVHLHGVEHSSQGLDMHFRLHFENGSVQEVKLTHQEHREQ